MVTPFRCVAFLLAVVLLTGSLRADENASVRALVAEAGKACDALPPGKASPELRPVWLQLATARVGIGDVAGGIEALDRVNKDHDYSVCTAWIMQIESTGKLPAEPAVMDPKVLEMHRLGAMNVLANLGEFELALAQVQKLPAGENQQIGLARCYLQAGHAYYKGKNKFVIDGKGDIKCLENFKNALDAIVKIRNPQATLPLLLELCERYSEIDLEMAAEPLVRKVEEALEAMPPNLGTLQLWQHAGKTRLLLEDEAGAKKDFETAKALYAKHGEPQTKVAWDGVAFPVFELQLRFEVLRKQKLNKEAAELIPAWEKALTALDVKYKTPKMIGSLVDACLLCGDAERARQVLDGLNVRHLELILGEIGRDDELKSNAQANAALGAYCEGVAAKPDMRPAHAAALLIACECFRKVNDRPKFLACYTQGLKVSTEEDYEYHVAFGRFLIDAGRIEQAQALAKDLPPVQRANLLTGLAALATNKLNKAAREAGKAKP